MARTLTRFDIDYSKRCDVVVGTTSMPPFVMLISGYTAAELSDDMGDLLVDVVKASLRRRGVSDDETVSIGTPKHVKLFGQSGRPR